MLRLFLALFIFGSSFVYSAEVTVVEKAEIKYDLIEKSFDPLDTWQTVYNALAADQEILDPSNFEFFDSLFSKRWRKNISKLNTTGKIHRAISYPGIAVTWATLGMGGLGLDLVFSGLSHLQYLAEHASSPSSMKKTLDFMKENLKWETFSELYTIEQFTEHEKELSEIVKDSVVGTKTKTPVVSVPLDHGEKVEANSDLISTVTYVPVQSFLKANSVLANWVSEEVGNQDIEKAKENWKARRDEVLGAITATGRYIYGRSKQGAVGIFLFPMVNVANLTKDAVVATYVAGRTALVPTVMVPVIAVILPSAFVLDKFITKGVAPALRLFVVAGAGIVLVGQGTMFVITRGPREVFALLGASVCATGACLAEGGRHVVNSVAFAGQYAWLGLSNVVYYGPRELIYQTIHKYQTTVELHKTRYFSQALHSVIRKKHPLSKALIFNDKARIEIPDVVDIALFEGSDDRVAIEVNYDNDYEDAQIENGKKLGQSEKQVLKRLEQEYLTLFRSVADRFYETPK